MNALMVFLLLRMIGPEIGEDALHLAFETAFSFIVKTVVTNRISQYFGANDIVHLAAVTKLTVVLPLERIRRFCGVNGKKPQLIVSEVLQKQGLNFLFQLVLLELKVQPDKQKGKH